MHVLPVPEFGISEPDESLSQVPHACGVSRQSVHAWVRKCGQSGLSGLVDRSHRPASCPHRIAAEVEAAPLTGEPLMLLPDRDPSLVQLRFPRQQLLVAEALRQPSLGRIYRSHGRSPSARMRRLTTSPTAKSHPVRRCPLQLIPTRKSSSARSGKAALRQ
ncbi:leucine zipper domain-containing protein [Streptomyces sp. NPDC096354]|uniref:leucine zipper domain-containing protein n=1 Tax=Streptomyces sp. NPDC096354 TaxID=3366088 RepID=UPI0038064ED5